MRRVRRTQRSNTLANEECMPTRSWGTCGFRSGSSSSSARSSIRLNRGWFRRFPASLSLVRPNLVAFDWVHLGGQLRGTSTEGRPTGSGKRARSLEIRPKNGRTRPRKARDWTNIGAGGTTWHGTTPSPAHARRREKRTARMMCLGCARRSPKAELS